MRSIVGELKPKDIIEAIWAKDIIDLIWEAKRLRRWRSLILVQADLAAAEDLIKPGLHNADPMGCCPLRDLRPTPSLQAG